VKTPTIDALVEIVRNLTGKDFTAEACTLERLGLGGMLRFVKTGPESSRIELANAGQLTVNRGLVFTMSPKALLDLRRPAVHCTRRRPRREQMACRFRPVDRNASAVLHIGE
jgi:hypothetical protein